MSFWLFVLSQGFNRRKRSLTLLFIDADAELAQLLANPRFMAEPVFSREHYLLHVTSGIFGHFLRLTNHPPAAIKQTREMYRDEYCLCVKTGIFVAWGFDLDQVGQTDGNGREAYIQKARPPKIPVTLSTQIQEQVLGRDVVRIQLEPDVTTPGSPPKAQIVQLKDIGWYVAALVLPAP